KIIVNFLSNAFKFTPSGGEIHLDLKCENDLIIISVSDTGRGIAPENIPHLFDRFYQVEKSELQPGSGIGLAIAKELTLLHGGKIEVSSKIGFGSTFKMTFPLIERIKNEAPAHKISNLESAGLWDSRQEVINESGEVDTPGFQDSPVIEESTDRKTILIVDDNLDIRTYVAENLSANYDILQAQSGREALLKIRNYLPDLIISDVMMPDGDGFELLAGIRSDHEFAFLPVILLTAKAQVEDKLEGLKIGADDYLTKPFDITELKLRVNNILLSRKRLLKHLSNSTTSGQIK